MRTLTKSRRAVSPVIAVVLLIALTVAAAAIVYQIVNSTSSEEPVIVITNVEFTSNSQVLVTIKNTGTGDATNIKVRIGGTFTTNGATTYTSSDSGGTTSLEAGKSITLTISISGTDTFVDGNTYTFYVQYTASGSSSTIVSDSVEKTYIA